MKVRLVIIAGRHAGRQFEFKEHQTFLAGRAPYAHLRFPDDDPYFSRTHFLLELNPPHCRLVDLGSTNGTRVNGRQVHEVALKDGDVIEAGETKILIVIPTSKPDEPSSVAPAATLVAEVDPRTELPPSPLRTDIDNGAPPADANRLSDAADELAGYHILRELGRGTFGVVYLAEKNDRQFAVKVLLGDLDVNTREARRFVREINVLKRLRHPSIVRLRSAGRAAGRLYCAMEYVQGQNLEQLLAEKGPLKARSAARVIRHVLSGLQYAHEQGFVHRDIKPANIIVNSKHAKLADFGLACSFQATMLSGCTLQGETGGSLGYMAPEQILEFHQATPANDIYSIGATLYRLVSGEPVYDFPEGFSQRLRIILQQDPIPVEQRNPKLPKEFSNLVNRCLRRDPGSRWSSAKELYEALTPFAARQVSPTRSARESRPAPRKSEAAVTAKRSVGGQNRVMWRLEGEPGGANEQMPLRGTATTAGDHSIAVALGTVLIRATTQGEVVSRCELNQPVIGSPALSAEGLAIVHARDGQVHGVDPSGQERWRTSVGEPLGWASPLIDDSGNCWIAGSRGGLLRLNDRGEQDRRPFFRSLQRFDCTGMIHRDTLYIGAEDGFVYAINLAASKGRNRWNQSDDHGKANWFINGSILMRREEEVVATGGDGTVFGFSLNGEPIWSWSLSGKAIASARSCGSGFIYQGLRCGEASVSKPFGRLSCFDPEAGRERWRFDCSNPIESTAAIDGEGNVYVGDNAGFLYSVDRRGQERWRIELGPPIRSQLTLHPTEPMLLVISDNAQLSAIDVT